MQSYKRKITYFCEFHSGNVGSTAGYLKLEIRGDKVKIIINIQEPLGLPYKGASLYFYHETGDCLTAVKVDEIESVDGVLTYHTRTDWQSLFDTGRDLYTFDGVVVKYNDSHYFIGDFADRNRTGYRFVWKEPVDAVSVNQMSSLKEKVPLEQSFMREKKTMTEDMQSDTEISVNDALDQELFSCENCPYQEKRKELSKDRDPFEMMLEEYPKVSMYDATEFSKCVRIHPKDIGKLDMRFWKLGVNSFLTHGFYTYQYLLLGKMRMPNGTEQPVIGVPGVYSNREKYVANMFGFEQFVPVKKTGLKMGEFGYWVVILK